MKEELRKIINSVEIDGIEFSGQYLVGPEKAVYDKGNCSLVDGVCENCVFSHKGKCRDFEFALKGYLEDYRNVRVSVDFIIDAIKAVYHN